MKNDYDANDDDLTDDYYESDGLRWISIVVVILVIFGFFSLAWYAYRTNTEGVKTGDMSLVQADPTPMKEKPENPGGMEFEHKDKDVYNRIVAKGGKDDNSEDNVEKLLPEAEEPIVEKSAPKHQEGIQTWINDKIHPDSDAPASEQKSEAAAIAEKKSHEEKVREMAESVEQSPKSDTEVFVKREAAEPVEPKEAAVEVGEAPVATQASTVEAKPAQKTTPPAQTPPVKAPAEEAAKPQPAKTEPVKSEPVKAAAPAPAKTAQGQDPIVAAAENYGSSARTAASPAGSSPSGAGKGAQAQLASLRSRAEAETTLARIRAKHADLLAGRNFSIVEADVPGKGAYFRIRVSGADRATLTQLCSSLKARGQDCIPVQ